MTHDLAADLVRDLASSAYDEALMRRAVRNLFGDDAETDERALTGAYVFEAFRGQVRQHKRLAKAQDADGDEVDVLAVELADGAMLDRARTMQRNFVATYLDRKGRDAALVAFYAADRPDWRLSLVRLELTTVEGEGGRLKTEKELTPARRYSFLMGPGEATHTAEGQLVTLLEEGRPTLDRIEDQFGVERVTKDFFNEYRELFFELQDQIGDELARSAGLRAEFERAELDAVGFAKKLLGQIVFLYFVQKKGWLGVPEGAAWGEGPRDFLRRLYDDAYGPADDFYDGLLEPLFYEALASERGADGYYSRFGCRIPFLNGGLFEPPGDYAWQRVPLPLPRATFGKILDTFDRFNFTVREDEPLEKEVAVDPEMLGKVFENLLDVEDRKAKGAFYTPREIVSYMCDQSLVAYLDTALNGDGAGGRRTARQPLTSEAAPQSDIFGGTPPVQAALAVETDDARVPPPDLEALVRDGARWAEHDTRVAGEGRETPTYAFQAPAAVREHAAALDQALADVTVCDPAIGSGAFPVGMMQAIVRVREALTPYVGGAGDRSPYALKRHAIQHSLYGVDLEPSAVDIARLRLWLSLVVDEDDYRRIQPLPNLRYRIVEGDALGSIQHSLENNEAYDRLQALIPRHIETSSPVAKHALQDEIDALIERVSGGAFDPGVYFGDVMLRGGFDVVIGNPPYVSLQRLPAAQRGIYADKGFQVYTGGSDLYALFIERGMQVLRPGGVFAYIVSNKWMRAGYGQKLRAWLAGAGRRIVEVINFGDLPVFQGITTFPCILRLERGPAAPTFHALNVQTLDYGDLWDHTDAAGFSMRRADLDPSGWALVEPETQALLNKLAATGRPLAEVVGDEIYHGVKTGYNEAFVIDAATRRRLVEKDPKSEALIKPFVAGREVKRYRRPSPTNHLIVIPNGWTDAQTDEDDKWDWFSRTYPALAEHLTPHAMTARKRWDKGTYWWELRPCSYYEAFDEPKILYQEIATYSAFTWDDSGVYTNNKVFFLPGADLVLLGLLNSRLVWYFLAYTTGQMVGGAHAMQSPYVLQIPIAQIDEANREHVQLRGQIRDAVVNLLTLRTPPASEDRAAADARQSEVARLERAVDRAVYRLYGLTEAEVALVEAKVPPPSMS